MCTSFRCIAGNLLQDFLLCLFYALSRSMRQEFLQIFCETAASRFNEACLCALGRGSATIIGTTFYDAASRKSILNRSFGGTSSIEEAEFKNEYLAFFCQLPSPAI